VNPVQAMLMQKSIIHRFFLPVKPRSFYRRENK
jgi:hypothetical protein